MPACVLEVSDYALKSRVVYRHAKKVRTLLASNLRETQKREKCETQNTKNAKHKTRKMRKCETRNAKRHAANDTSNHLPLVSVFAISDMDPIQVLSGRCIRWLVNQLAEKPLTMLLFTIHKLDHVGLRVFLAGSLT
jgi:hypothetical protein